LAIYEPGFLRAGAALARAVGTKVPIYRLMFCETMAVGFPPRPYALAAYLVLLAIKMVRDHGGEPATPAEMRQALAAMG
jgi:hypothetical protein